MLRICTLVVVLATVAFGRFAYQLPAGSETILSQPLQYTFHCTGRPYGYYADIDNNCQVFHVCQPVIDDLGLIETAHFSFVCGIHTVFSQDSLTCIHRDSAPPCRESQDVDAPFLERVDERKHVPANK
ncbi:unnamed protein product [Meganyctiphanes norvegica]|uniref:Chitin-binding type-2 domain-containing protein n=1 Tax=Meganyctiphanes norvegica TaxID=48144 RepID=A0AAV2QF36_MEGNR